jgi:hypothetical protein
MSTSIPLPLRASQSIFLSITGLYNSITESYKGYPGMVIIEDVIMEGTTAEMSFVILDYYGEPLALGEVNTLTLTFRDDLSEQIINTREAQNVLNTNDVTFGIESLPETPVDFIGSSKVIRLLSGNWSNFPIREGIQIIVSGSIQNNATFHVVSVSGTDLRVQEAIVSESGQDITISIPGKVTWTMQPGDTVILDERLAEETKIASFSWVWDTINRGAQDFTLIIGNRLEVL